MQVICLVCREEVEQEDYQEKIVLQLAEQEEEDLNKIKEESRRRRQAILEKYKAQQLQRESHLEDTGKVPCLWLILGIFTSYLLKLDLQKDEGFQVVSLLGLLGPLEFNAVLLNIYLRKRKW